MRLTVEESARSAQIVKVRQKKIIKEAEKHQAQRREQLVKMRDMYDEGAISMDMDDPKSYRGYTESEARFITGELSDDEYDDLKQNQENYGETL